MEAAPVTSRARVDKDETSQEVAERILPELERKLSGFDDDMSLRTERAAVLGAVRQVASGAISLVDLTIVDHIKAIEEYCRREDFGVFREILLHLVDYSTRIHL